MNKLLWINEKELNEENIFISKLKTNIEISGYWVSNNDIKPITFENEDIIINWSYEENKAEFYLTDKYAESFAIYYFHLMYYGEWGLLREKPIIFMEIASENETIKSKKPFKSKEILKYIKKKKKVNINIYFETTIQKDPESELYNEEENLWVSSLGGLYDIIYPSWEINGKKNIKLNKKEWKFNDNNKIKIKEYINWIKYEKIYKETALTAKELKLNKSNWEIFKFNYF